MYVEKSENVMNGELLSLAVYEEQQSSAECATVVNFIGKLAIKL